MTERPFDIEQAVGAWRRDFAGRSRYRPEDIDELESHLRDRAASLQRHGLAAKAAFQQAAQEVGAPWAGEEEYGKVYWGKVRRSPDPRREARALLSTAAGMLCSHGAVALRNLWRSRLFTAIHLAGLSIGMVGCILIYLYTQEELRYADFHSKGDRVYRVLRESRQGGTWKIGVGTSGALTPAMRAEFPQVEAAARLLDDWWVLVRRGETQRMIDVALGDPELLEMFDIELLTGDVESALARPNTAVITPGTARFFFGEEDPIGQVLSVEDGNLGKDYVITGILSQMSPYATVSFAMLTAQPTPESRQLNGVFDSWQVETSWRPFKNFVMLRQGADVEAVRAALPAFAEKHLGAAAADVRFHLQPVNRIRLYSRADYGMVRRADQGWSDQDRSIGAIYRLGLVGGLILVIACVNFMNLATAQSGRRAREVGLRKVIGAARGQLVRQFLGEALLLSSAALVLAYGLAWLTLPAFNAFMETDLAFAHDATLIGVLAGLALVVGLVSGGYPALFLSRFRPAQTIRGRLTSRASARGLRRTLVVAQFAISGVLVVASIVVYQQTNFMMGADLGFDPHHLVNVPVGRYDVDTDLDVVRGAFAEAPGVLDATVSHPAPGSWNGAEYHDVRPEGAAEGEWRMQVIGIDSHFLETFGIDLAAGRNLRPNRADDPDAFLLNEAAVRQLGWEEPVGKRFDWLGRKQGTVVGVVRDFHVQSLKSRIEPLVMHYWARHTVTVRISGDDLPATMAGLRQVWSRFLPEAPFEHWFVVDNLALAYEAEATLNRTCLFFSALAVFISCLGLFGLATFAAEQRTREIGIRKSLGATVTDIVALFSRDFVLLVSVANLAAAPVAWWLTRRWLESFPYRVDLSVLPFAVCTAVTLAVALLTVSIQSVRAASANPVEALRHE